MKKTFSYSWGWFASFLKKKQIIDNFIKSVSSLNFIINFSKKDISRVSFVSGYKYKEIKINSKNLKVIKNKNGEQLDQFILFFGKIKKGRGFNNNLFGHSCKKKFF